MATPSPANLASIALAILGMGLIAMAVSTTSVGAIGLVLGIALIVAALITAGLGMLTRHGVPTRPTEDA